MRLDSRLGARDTFGIPMSKNNASGKSANGNSVRPLALGGVNRYAKNKAINAGTWPTVP